MEKIIKGMMVLLFSLILLAAVPALAEQNTTLLFDGKLEQWGTDYFQQVAAVGDTLYIARSSGLYSYHMGDEAPKQLMDFTKTDLSGNTLPEGEKAMNIIGTLLGTADSLYSLDLIDGTLWRFDHGTAAFIKEASFEPAPADENEQYMYSGYCMEGGSVYYIAADAMSPISNLMRLDLLSGKKGLVRSGIELVAPYAPGVLLVGLNTMSSYGSLALLDTKTGSLEEKLKLSGAFRKMNYDPATDTVYLWRKGEIYASKAFQAPETAARVPIAGPVADGTLIAGGYMAYPYEEGVRIFSTDPKLLTDVPLKVAGQTFELPVDGFSKANPDVTFSFIDAFPETTADLVMHMMGDENAADVYALYLSAYNMDSLYEKGYYADLKDSGIITSNVSAMYPFIKDVLMRDGKIIALPFTAKYNTYNYNPQAFEAAGLSEKDVPQSYDDLLDFIQNWGTEYAEKYPSMSLFGYDTDPKLYKRIVAKSIIEDRMYTCLRRGEPVTYDTPEMKALFEKLLATDFSVINALTPESTANDYMTLKDWPKQLFHMCGASTETAYTDFFSYMPLKLSEGEQPVVLVEIQALIINPYTQNYDAAQRFVEFMAVNQSGIIRANLMPEENEPIRDPYFDVKWLEKEISDAEKAWREAKEEDKRSIQDRLDLLHQEYDQQKGYEWLATEKSIASFRALDPYFMLQIPNPIFSLDANKELVDLFYNRFMDGQIAVDQFLEELDQKLRMIELEN